MATIITGAITFNPRKKRADPNLNRISPKNISAPCEDVRKKVVVYNTYADKGKLHFDVFIPTDKSQSTQVPEEIDSEAVEYAKEFLTLLGKPSEDIAVNMCESCHIYNTDLYASELWKLLLLFYLHAHDTTIWTLYYVLHKCPRMCPQTA